VLDEMVVGRRVDITASLELDPVELLDNRLREKMALSRYGRIDPFSWEHRDINELRDHYRVLVDLLKSENRHAQQQEDR